MKDIKIGEKTLTLYVTRFEKRNQPWYILVKILKETDQNHFTNTLTNLSAVNQHTISRGLYNANIVQVLIKMRSLQTNKLHANIIYISDNKRYKTISQIIDLLDDQNILNKN